MKTNDFFTKTSFDWCTRCCLFFEREKIIFELCCMKIDQLHFCQKGQKLASEWYPGGPERGSRAELNVTLSPRRHGFCTGYRTRTHCVAEWTCIHYTVEASWLKSIEKQPLFSKQMQQSIPWKVRTLFTFVNFDLWQQRSRKRIENASSTKFKNM